MLDVVKRLVSVSESTVTVAAIQAAPVFLDLEASLQKALGLIETAANGAQLLVFPEAFLPAPPVWVDEVLPGEDAAWHIRLLEQSVVVPGPVTERLGAAARHTGVHLEGRPCRTTIVAHAVGDREVRVGVALDRWPRCAESCR
jgi:predicted amidohydrolase